MLRHQKLILWDPKDPKDKIFEVLHISSFIFFFFFVTQKREKKKVFTILELHGDYLHL